MENMMQNVTVPPETILQTVHARGQIFGEVNGNYHNIVYNIDLDQPAIVAGWTALRDFYQLTGDHLVSLTHYGKSAFFLPYSRPIVYPNHSQDDTLYTINMYYFLKDKGWTHLHLENVAEYRLVFNHWRKTLKIRVGWKHLCETLSLIADMEIVFEFIDPTLNRVLYWPCL
ncbi:hypothetical protein HKD37_18G050059 [Glycine soja]